MLIRYLCFILLLAATSAYSQQGPEDTAFIQSALDSSVAIYEKSIGLQHQYLNGSAYVEPPRTGEQHPFFLSDDWTLGPITFDGQQYNNVPMLYDLTIDQVVSESAGANPQLLQKAKLQKFTLSGHQFIKIDGEASLPESGFYHVLYEGPSQVICRRRKFKYDRPDSSIKLEIIFEEKNRFFILKDSDYLPVRSRRSVLKVLSDQKAQIRTFVRKNQIRFKKNLDVSLPVVARFYDTLIRSQE